MTGWRNNRRSPAKGWTTRRSSRAGVNPAPVTSLDEGWVDASELMGIQNGRIGKITTFDVYTPPAAGETFLEFNARIIREIAHAMGIPRAKEDAQ